MSEVKEKKVFIKRKETVAHRQCLNCGKFIDERHGKAKYCSIECWQAHTGNNPVGGYAQMRYENFLFNR